MKAEQVVPGRLRKGSIRDLLYVLFGHKGKMLTFMVLLFGAVAVMTFLQPNTYRSEARLLLRLGRETVSLDPTATIGEIAHINRTHDREISSELEILKSREIVERVVDHLGVKTFTQSSQTAPADEVLAVAPPAPGVLRAVRDVLAAVKAGPARLAAHLGLSVPLGEREGAIRRVLQNLEIEAMENTNVINVSYNELSPGLARDVLERFIQAYLEKHLAVYCPTDSQRFFELQVSELREKLTQAEKDLQDLKDTSGVSSLQEQRLVMVNTIGERERHLAETEAELASANARIAGIQAMLAQIPETVVTEEITGFSDYGADLMRSRLYELRLAEKDLEAKYTQDSRQLEMIRQQVGEAMAILEKEQSKPTRTEVKKGLNSAYQQMQLALLTEQSSVSSLQSKLEKTRDQVAQARAALRALNDIEVKTSRLEREIALLEGSYNRYFDKLEEARIDQALKSERISSISILQAATTPIMPIGPRRGLRLGLGLLLALVGGLGFAFLCEYLDHSLKTPEDVQEKLQLPLLASIPRTRLNRVRPVSKSPWSRWLGVFPRPSASSQWDIPEHVRRHYVDFRERFLLHADGSLNEHYVIGVTSCSRCEGVSTAAANLASSLSEQSSVTVLLVDANTRYPAVHRIFRTKLSPGLADALAANPEEDGDDTIIHRTANLRILTAGSVNGSAARAVASDSLAHFLHSTKQDYRFIVVDMPALDEDGSLIRLAGACDGVILVVEAQRLRWEVVAKAKQQLLQWNINLLGVLLNKRRFPVPNWIYAAL